MYETFTHVDGFMETSDRFYLISMARICTEVYDVKRVCLEGDDNGNFGLRVGLFAPNDEE